MASSTFHFVLLALFGLRAAAPTCTPISSLSFCRSFNGMLGSPAIVANGWLVDARAIAITKALSKGSTTYDTCGFSTPQCCASLKELACGAAARTLAIDAGITAGSCQLESQSVSYSTCIATTSSCSPSGGAMYLPPLPSLHNVSLSPFFIYQDTYCDVLTGSPPTVSPTPSPSNNAPEEATCDMATFVNNVHAAEVQKNFSDYETACMSTITALRYGGQRFGPSSPYERFVILCRTCALYKTYWEPVVTLSSASSCDCTQFSLNRCPHFLPAQWLCQVTGYCPEQFSYDQEYCAVNACGVNAQDEATWRQCNYPSSGVRAIPHVAPLLALALCALWIWRA